MRKVLDKTYNVDMINNTQIEICIGNIDDALIASKYPIDRIELNSALELGGLSPSLETLIYLKENIKQKICCMVRPRGGDFCFSDLEFKIMLETAKSFLDNGADGIVFGFLNKDKSIDAVKTRKMIELIHQYKKEAIFHKAFDDSNDKFEAIKILNDLKIDRILTGGGESSENILKGCELINKLHNEYPNIQLLPGGGVRVNNIKDVIKTAGTGQIHMTAKMISDGGYIKLEESQLQAMLREIESI